MLLYTVLLMLYDDRQGDVDAFILGEDPNVPRTPSPYIPGVMETVYPRPRNELGHHRPAVNLDNTRVEMAGRLEGVKALIKRAIELHP